MAKKKNYTICINPDVYEGLRELVTARGHSMSGYLEVLIRENYEQLKALGGRPRGKQSIIDALNAGSDPADFGFDCRADDGQGNEYWCKNQGSVVVRLNCYTDPKTDKKYWDDDVSGWENQ